MDASSDLSATIAFIGIGNMGWGMAMNLRAKLPKSSKFIICEINEARRAQFVEEADGLVQVATSPREAAGMADIIITMLPKARHVHEAFTNPETGFLSLTKSKNATSKFFIECSTIDTATSTSIGSMVSSSDIGSFIDAPVSGGPQGASAGTLTFMVGGSQQLFDKSLPVLEMMGKKENIFFCGGPGAGLATKQLNNYLGYIGYMGLCEVMNTGILYGLDPKTLSDVLNKSSGMNWNSLHHNPVKGVNPASSSSHDFRPGFTTELAAGVIDDAVALMHQVGAKSVLGPTVQGVFHRALDNDKCRGMEARSLWRMFAEDGGRDLDGL